MIIWYKWTFFILWVVIIVLLMNNPHPSVHNAPHIFGDENMEKCSNSTHYSCRYLKMIKSKDLLYICIFCCICAVCIHFRAVYVVFCYKTRWSNWKHQANNLPFPRKESQKHSEVLTLQVTVWFPKGHIHIRGRDPGLNFYFSTMIRERIPLWKYLSVCVHVCVCVGVGGAE